MTEYERGLLAGKAIIAANDTSSLIFVERAQAGAFDDVTITEHADAFPVWSEHFIGVTNTIVIDPDDGALYRLTKDFATPYPQSQPSKDKSSWEKVGNPADEYPEWSQPLGAHDAYQIGDKCSFDGKHYINEYAGNTYPPNVYGWKET